MDYTIVQKFASFVRIYNKTKILMHYRYQNTAIFVN